MSKVKIIMVCVGIILALIIFYQNTETVDTRLLFVTFSMPRVILLCLTFVLGVLVGLGLSLGPISKKVKPDAAE